MAAAKKTPQTSKKASTPSGSKRTTVKATTSRARPEGAKGRASRSKTTSRSGAQRPARVRRPSPAQQAVRNQTILDDKDRLHMSWVQIARKHKLTVNGARKAYDAAVEANEDRIDEGEKLRNMRSYLRRLEGIQSDLAKLARASRAPVIQKVAAFRELVNVMWKEIALRQALGDLPENLGDLVAAREMEWTIDQVIEVLAEAGIGDDVLDKILEKTEKPPLYLVA